MHRQLACLPSLSGIDNLKRPTRSLSVAMSKTKDSARPTAPRVFATTSGLVDYIQRSGATTCTAVRPLKSFTFHVTIASAAYRSASRANTASPKVMRRARYREMSSAQAPSHALAASSPAPNGLSTRTGYTIVNADNHRSTSSPERRKDAAPQSSKTVMSGIAASRSASRARKSLVAGYSRSRRKKRWTMMRLLSRKTKAVALRCAVHLLPAPVGQRPRCLARDALELRPPGHLGQGARPSRLDLPLQLPIDGIGCHRGWSGGWPDRGDHLTSPRDGHRFAALDAPEDGGGLVLQLAYGNLSRRSHVATNVANWRTVGQGRTSVRPGTAASIGRLPPGPGFVDARPEITPGDCPPAPCAETAHAQRERSSSSSRTLGVRRREARDGGSRCRSARESCPRGRRP